VKNNFLLVLLSSGLDRFYGFFSSVANVGSSFSNQVMRDINEFLALESASILFVYYFFYVLSWFLWLVLFVVGMETKTIIFVAQFLINLPAYVFGLVLITECVSSAIQFILPEINMLTAIFVSATFKRIYCSSMIYYLPLVYIVNPALCFQLAIFEHAAIVVTFLLSYLYDVLVTYRPLTAFERNMNIDNILCRNRFEPRLPLIAHFGEDVPVCIASGHTIQHSDLPQLIASWHEIHPFNQYKAVENKTLAKISGARHSLFGLTETVFLQHIDPTKPHALIDYRTGWTEYSHQQGNFAYVNNLVVEELMRQYNQIRNA